MSEAHVGYLELEDFDGRLEPSLRWKLGRSLKFWKDADDRPAIGLCYDVTLWGAKGDGTTDDTTAVQAAINAAEVNGGIVFFPAGTYKITSQLALDTDNVMLVGAGSHASSAVSQPGAASTLKFVLGSATEAVVITERNIHLRNLAIEAGGGSETTAIYIYLPTPTTTIAKFGIDNVSIDGGFSQHGIHAYGIENLDINHCYIMDCTGYGIYLQTHATYQGINNTIRNTRVSRCGGTTYNASIFIDGMICTEVNNTQCLDQGDEYGILIEDALETRIINCDIERPNTSTGIRAYRCDNLTIANTVGFTLDIFIEIVGASGNTAHRTKLERNRCGSSVTTGLKLGAYVEDLVDDLNRWNAGTTDRTGMAGTGSSGIRIIGAPVDTPATLSDGRVDNYAIDDEAETLRLTPGTGTQLSGMTLGWSGRRVRLTNIGSTNLTLLHQDANSSAANQFRIANAASVRLLPNGSADVEYHGATTKWVVANVFTDSEAYSPSNVTTDRTFDADATTLAELADVVGTLISDLQGAGKLG